jgi:transcriptional regulator with XRE-family HTH domain
MISIREIKAARMLLGWSQEELAMRAAVSYPTIARLESRGGEIGGRSETAAKIRMALEAAGVKFFLTYGQPGVRLGYAVRTHTILKEGIGAIEDYSWFEDIEGARSFAVDALLEWRRMGAILGYRPISLPDYFWARYETDDRDIYRPDKAITFAGAPMNSAKLAICKAVDIKKPDED